MTRIYKNLVEMQENSCRLYRNREMYGTKLEDGHYHFITFSEMKLQIDAIRGGLDWLGVGPKDKVGIIARNCVEWAVCCYASLGRGAHFVSMYENQCSEDWKFILLDSGAKIVFTYSKEIYEQVKAYIGPELPQLKYVILIKDEQDVGSDRVSKETIRSFKQLLKVGQSYPISSLSVERDEPLGLIYTSGTTGRPKGVILSHGNILSNLYLIPDYVDLNQHDRGLSILPWAHIFGQVAEVHAAFYLGFSLGFVENINSLMTNLMELRPTLLFAVPRLYNRIYDGINSKMMESPLPIRNLFFKAMAVADKIREGEDISLSDRLLLRFAEKTLFKAIKRKFGGRLKLAVSGASALNSKIARFIDNLGITVIEAYGLSETSPIVSANSMHKRKFGSVGQVARNQFSDIRVVIDHEVLGENVQTCEEGEIIVYGPNVMQGYHNLPEETAKVMTKDGGFRTGDLGRIDEDGFLYITGRIKEQYKLENGKYVVPNIMEDQLKLSLFISNAYIFGSNKNYNIALIIVEKGELLKWANQNGLEKKDISELLSHSAVLSLYQKEIDVLKEYVKSYELPKKFLLLNDDWNIENGFLTPSLKLKRQHVYNVYKEIIESLYL